VNIAAELARLNASLEKLADAETRRADATAQAVELDRTRTSDYHRAVDGMLAALERMAPVLLSPAQAPPRPPGTPT
jgi:hypothetical protein